ncbi:MAG: hypothetical protein ACYS0I_05975 [Planctomycetota bacterium]|jgi:hypothetical protein
MTDFDNINSSDEELDEPIPFDEEDTNEESVSHSPLNLGGGEVKEAPKAKPTSGGVMPVTKKSAKKIVSMDRITSVKTFFTKLSPGAMEYLDEQISEWLQQNPGIRIHRTNITTGDVAGKNVEPNIIITVWY